MYLSLEQYKFKSIKSFFPDYSNYGPSEVRIHTWGFISVRSSIVDHVFFLSTISTFYDYWLLLSQQRKWYTTIRGDTLWSLRDPIALSRTPRTKSLKDFPLIHFKKGKVVTFSMFYLWICLWKWLVQHFQQVSN